MEKNDLKMCVADGTNGTTPATITQVWNTLALILRQTKVVNSKRRTAPCEINTHTIYSYRIVAVKGTYILNYVDC